LHAISDNEIRYTDDTDGTDYVVVSRDYTREWPGTATVEKAGSLPALAAVLEFRAGVSWRNGPWRRAGVLRDEVTEEEDAGGVGQAPSNGEAVRCPAWSFDMAAVALGFDRVFAVIISRRVDDLPGDAVANL
jgi:hypothetical protein